MSELIYDYTQRRKKNRETAPKFKKKTIMCACMCVYLTQAYRFKKYMQLKISTL